MYGIVWYYRGGIGGKSFRTSACPLSHKNPMYLSFLHVGLVGAHQPWPTVPSIFFLLINIDFLTAPYIIFHSKGVMFLL